jgi:hypothetical protein
MQRGLSSRPKAKSAACSFAGERFAESMRYVSTKSSSGGSDFVVGPCRRRFDIDDDGILDIDDRTAPACLPWRYRSERGATPPLEAIMDIA